MVCDPSYSGESTVEVYLVYKVSSKTAWTVRLGQEVKPDGGVWSSEMQMERAEPSEQVCGGVQWQNAYPACTGLTPSTRKQTQISTLSALFRRHYQHKPAAGQWHPRTPCHRAGPQTRFRSQQILYDLRGQSAFWQATFPCSYSWKMTISSPGTSSKEPPTATGKAECHQLSTVK